MNIINKFYSDEIIIAIEDSLYKLLPTLDELVFEIIFISKSHFIINHKYYDFQLVIDYRFLNDIKNEKVIFNSLNDIIINIRAEKSLMIYKFLYKNNKFKIDNFVKERGYKGLEEFRRYLNDLDDWLRFLEKDILDRFNF